jgi:MFS transporter, DHA2 family, multidrug resistance protein
MATIPEQFADRKPVINPWFIAITVMLAAFMELLDTSIANVTLPYIGGGLG